ncbi:MAG: toll/interleukin-1 receptor domain-containing protein, partial [Acidobacteria bacterium]|nr:toll/interleukin-1 receptor domain-containing protein [Acidobacteriota bacterium]
MNDLHGYTLKPGANLVAAKLAGADLVGATLAGADLTGADLSYSKLDGVDLTRAKLTGADLSHATLNRACLTGASLTDAKLVGTSLVKANLSDADLTRANLAKAHLPQAQVLNAKLTNASLVAANFIDSILVGCDFVGARLGHTNLTAALLRRTSFRGAELINTVLAGADLTDIDLTGATLRDTAFTDVDLSTVVGLDTCVHTGPSSLDHRTLLRSGRGLPLTFLRGCGLPDTFIDYLPSLLSQPIQFYSCFISHAKADEDFARRLYADLQAHGIRCWFAPHDMEPARRSLDQIDEAIRKHDRLLLILSPASMASSWVKTEIAKARDKEVTLKRQVLFPVSLVPFSELRSWTLFDADRGEDTAKEIREYHIPDFSTWKTDQDRYLRLIEKVIRQLNSSGRDPFRWTSFLWGIRCPDRWPTHRPGVRAANSLTSSRPAPCA